MLVYMVVMLVYMPQTLIWMITSLVTHANRDAIFSSVTRR